MTSHRGMTLLAAFCALLCVVAMPSARAQDDKVAALFDELEQTATYERSNVRKMLLRRYPQEALPVVVAKLEDINGNGDTNLVGQFIQLIGDIYDFTGRNRPDDPQLHAKATDVLLNYAKAANMSLAYQATSSLRILWTTSKIQRVEERMLVVNATLLARLHGRTPDHLKRAAAIALVEMNKIPVRNNLRASNYSLVPTDEYQQKIDAYFQLNPDKLPILARRPWELHLGTLVTTKDADARTAALETLRGLAPFDAVDSILSVLRDPAELDEGVRQNLADLLETITRINYPPTIEGDENPVDVWWGLWMDKLRTREGLTGARLKAAKDYVWRSLEEELYFYAVEPTPPGAQRIRDLRYLLMYILDSDAQIPASATPKALAMMAPPLESKARLALALRKFKEMTSSRDVPLSIASTELSNEWGGHIGRQFLQDIVNLTAVERDKQIALQLGDLLRKITKVPVSLNLETGLQRRRMLNAWVDIVKERGYEVKMPAREEES